MSAAAAPAERIHLTKVEAARYLGVSVRTLDRLPIAKVRLLGRVMFRRDTLDAWSRANESLA